MLAGAAREEGLLNFADTIEMRKVQFSVHAALERLKHSSRLQFDDRASSDEVIIVGIDEVGGAGHGSSLYSGSAARCRGNKGCDVSRTL